MICNINSLYYTIEGSKWTANAAFADCFPEELKFTNLGKSIESIYLGGFNKPIDKFVFPISLKILTLGMPFNQSLDKVKFPDSLEELVLSNSFNQSLNNVIFPKSLKILTSYGFNQPIDNIKFPDSLEQLNLENTFNQPIDKVIFPNALKQLKLGNTFNQPIDKVKFPDSLETILFWQFKHPIDSLKSLKKLKHIRLGTDYINDYTNFDNLERLVVHATNLAPITNTISKLQKENKLLKEKIDNLCNPNSIIDELNNKLKITEEENKKLNEKIDIINKDYLDMFKEMTFILDKINNQNKHNERIDELTNIIKKMQIEKQYNKLLIAIQDMNIMLSLESKDYGDYIVIKYLEKLRNVRNSDSHYILENCDIYCNYNLINDRRIILVEQINNMPNEIKNIFNKKYPKLLENIIGYIEPQNKKISSKENEEKVRDWWTE